MKRRTGVLLAALLVVTNPSFAQQMKIEVRQIEVVNIVPSSGPSSSSYTAKIVLPDGSHAKVTCLGGFDYCGEIEPFHPEQLPPDSKKCVMKSIGSDMNSLISTCTRTDLGFYQATRENNDLMIVVPSGTVKYHIESPW